MVEFPLAQRLAHIARDERGISMVAVGFWMIVILGFGAFSLDISRIYTEHSELQNAADAAALAIAGECATTGCGTGYDEQTVADAYADANARDGAVWVEGVTLDTAAHTVTVDTATEDDSGGNNFDVVLAQVLGYNGFTVRSHATATWGSPGGATTIPLIFSKCEWEAFGAPGYVDSGSGFLHRAAAVTSGALPPASGYAHEAASVTIYFHGSSTCHAGPSGQDLPGGFGWLESWNGDCEAKTSMDDWVQIDPGASPTSECSHSELQSLVGKVVMIPYFDDYVGTGTSAQYHVYGYGAMYVTGYNFAGQFKERSLIDNRLPCGGAERCIQGYMIGGWSGGGTSGGGPDLGVYSVQLSG